MTELTQEVKHSRIGKRTVPVPPGVQITTDNATMKVKGPKGELSKPLDASVIMVVKDGKVMVAPAPGSGKRGTTFQGLTRALVRNMIEGVSEGYKKSLDLHGVGYRAELKGQALTLGLGLSHQVKVDLPDAVKARVEIIDEGGTKRPRLHLESNDKELIGQTAARIKSYRPPEPYKGKGVRYTGEKIREKAGKAGGKGK